ncbi:hypothetical protein BDZ85DRAFT_263346 [Elsinoe ampelina]|uniref:Uncharacterized protein n=1 Tax=Elsinoe ampelina TaxID=302913 RepID=A0A6A6G9L1_9PEZI|nr:hypothetical protein BDZ85DRAFT_263346 [Elsinoe ampelina]
MRLGSSFQWAVQRWNQDCMRCGRKRKRLTPVAGTLVLAIGWRREVKGLIDMKVEGEFGNEAAFRTRTWMPTTRRMLVYSWIWDAEHCARKGRDRDMDNLSQPTRARVSDAGGCRP